MKPLPLNDRLSRAGLLLPHFRRGLVLSAVVHTVVWVFIKLLRHPTDGFAVAPITSLLIIAVTAALADTDARVARETLFEANLGMPFWTPAAAAAIMSAVMEILITRLS